MIRISPWLPPKGAKLGVRTQDMLGIFKDAGRGFAPLGDNPSGTGRIFPPAASRLAFVGPATLRHPLLAGGKIRSRHDGILIINRP
ncbi:hypothetical protein UF64_06720 [Thalassospira sp. HJ]|nr:hypothetical protein UF64_06720 [Thalassospira sp. HJ]